MSVLLGSAGAVAGGMPAMAATTATVALRKGFVEWRVNAAGVDTLRPRFHWTLRSSRGARNKRQTAVRIGVTDGFGSLIYDSGKVATDQLRFTPQDDLPLRSQRRYAWFLTVWDENGTATTAALAGTFTTGIFDPAQTAARWIGAQPQGPAYVQPSLNDRGNTAPNPPLPIFRKAFTPHGKPVSAVVSIAGLGQYRLFLNGKSISPNGMNGAWTHYAKRVLYDTYDVGDAVGLRENWLAVELGNGFFNVEGAPDRYRKYVGRYGPPQLWLQLRLVYADGSETLIVSDGTWTTREGPTTFSSIYGGEDYDARAYVPGWREGGGGAEGWRTPEILPGPGGALRAHTMTPMKHYKTLPARLIGQPKPGAYVYDCGINHSGRPILVVKGLGAGTRVRLRPAELLGDDGTIDQSSMTRWAEASTNIDFTFTAAGAAEERWEPGFTYVGYRYVQVEGADPAHIVSLSSDFLTDDFSQAGEFICTDDRLNRIHALIRQAVLSNAASCLTDCPTREKIGWLEQTYLNADAVLLNIDAAPLYEKIAADISDAQLASGMVPSFAPEYQRFADAHDVDNDLRNIPEWGSAVVLAPWAAYRLYGNLEALASCYPAMKKYAAYISTRIRPDGLVSFGIGDWYDFGPKPPGVAQLTSLAMTCTATLCHAFRCLAQIAGLLRQPDADAYRKQSDTFKMAVLNKLYDPDTHQFDRGSQAANAMALALDLAPAADRQAVLDNLIADIRSRQNHVSAGDVGFPYVVRALSMYGRGDVLVAMLQRDDSPSYGEQLANGATSLTEAWDGERISSQNHFMLGHIETWFYRGLGGINVDLAADPAHQIVIAPDWHCGVKGATTAYHSVFGRIASDWAMEAGRWRLNVEVPTGKSALLRLPDGRTETIGSGAYTFKGKHA